MTDARVMEWFCKGMVDGGQYTGGGQEQPEQERPEQRVAPKPTNRTMLHHHHAAFPVSWFERETATTPQSIANNSNKTMMIMTMIPNSAVWLHQFVPFHSSVVVWFFWLFLSLVSGEPNETTLPINAIRKERVLSLTD